MSTIILALLGVAFLLLGWSAWRWRTESDPASSVEGFARVLAAIDPDHTPPLRDPVRPGIADRVIDLDDVTTDEFERA